MTPKEASGIRALCCRALRTRVAAPAALAAPPASPQPAPSATRPIIPVGDVDTALTSKERTGPGRCTRARPLLLRTPRARRRHHRQAGEGGADRAAALAAMNGRGWG